MTSPADRSTLSQSCIMSFPSYSDSNFIVPNDHLALTLLEDNGSVFYLQIPLDAIRALCLKPLKYLLFLGWCILGAEGVLCVGDNEIDTDEEAVGGEIYQYVPAAPLGTFLLLSCVHAGHLSIHPRSCPSCRSRCHQSQDEHSL